VCLCASVLILSSYQPNVSPGQKLPLIYGAVSAILAPGVSPLRLLFDNFNSCLFRSMRYRCAVACICRLAFTPQEVLPSPTSQTWQNLTPFAPSPFTQTIVAIGLASFPVRQTHRGFATKKTFSYPWQNPAKPQNAAKLYNKVQRKAKQEP